MPRTSGIRLRLLTIVLLGVITSALAVLGLVRVLHLTTALRVERGRVAVAEQLAVLAEAPDGGVEPLPSAGVVGIRAGIVTSGAHPAAPAGWSAPLVEVVDESVSSRGVAEREVHLGDATLIVMARPAKRGDTAWAGYSIGPPTYLPFWRTFVILLAIATALLVMTSVYAVVTVTRGASELNRALMALRTDLRAPIPKPTVRELAEIAEGVAGLAESLAASRATEAALSRELATNERLAALGRVVAGVAHEVRNPLASIKLRLDLAAASKNPLPDSVTRAIAHASSEISRLDRLVADLLVVSGRALGPRVVSSVGDLVRTRADALAPWAAERGVKLVATGAATAAIDGDSLARAVDNLLRNAVEASAPGSIVSAVVETRDSAARITVVDRGGGVPREREAEVFEPFFTTKPDGTGLGLALSRAIARAHGGDVAYVRSGSETRFVLSVEPRSGDDQGRSPPVSEHQSQDAA